MPIFRLRGHILRWSFALDLDHRICNAVFFGAIIWEKNHDVKQNFEQLPG
jgi:hypothetical protein